MKLFQAFPSTLLLIYLLFPIIGSVARADDEIEALRKKAVSLRASGQYGEAANLYRNLAKKTVGQESDDGESIPRWYEAEARACECSANRVSTQPQTDPDALIQKLDSSLKKGDVKSLALLLDCDAWVGPWESHFDAPKGPENTAQEIISRLVKVKRLVRGSTKVLIEISNPSAALTTVFEVRKKGKGWWVHDVLFAEPADFERIAAQYLPGAKITFHP